MVQTKLLRTPPNGFWSNSKGYTGPRRSFTLGPWVMSKFFASICYGALLAYSSASSAGHEAFERLLENGSLRVQAEPSCEPYQLAADPSRYSQTLSQDIAWVLADMSGKAINIESSCEMGPRGNKFCKVIFSISEGELEWARIYQFESVSAKKGRSSMKNLRCFNLP